MSFGVLGKTGKGITEHYEIPVSAAQVSKCLQNYIVYFSFSLVFFVRGRGAQIKITLML